MLWKRLLLALLLATICLIGWRIAAHGDRLDSQLLRAGGNLIQSAAQRPGRTLGVFGAVLGTVWIGVFVASCWQARRARNGRSPADSPVDGRANSLETTASERE